LIYSCIEIQYEYDLAIEPDNELVYFEIRKGMYGLQEAGIMACNDLIEHLALFGDLPMCRISETSNKNNFHPLRRCLQCEILHQR